MSPKWLGAIGQASPSINQAITDIEERPKKALLWNWQQEKMGLEREQFGQQKALHASQMEKASQGRAIGQETLNKMQYEERQRKEKEAYLNQPWNAKTDLLFVDLPEEYQEKALKMLQSTGLVDENGVGKMKHREMVTEMFKSKPEIFEWVAKGRETKLMTIVEKAREDYQKVSETPNPDPEKLEKARQNFVASARNLEMFTGKKNEAVEKMHKVQETEKMARELLQSDAWKSLPREQQNIFAVSLIAASKTGDLTAFNDVIKEVAKSLDEKSNSAQMQALREYRKIPGNEGKTIEDFMKFESGLKNQNKPTMTDVKSAYSMELTNIKNQMMIDMTPDEQVQISGQAETNILAMLVANTIGKKLPPDKKEYYKAELKKIHDYYGEMTKDIFRRKGANLPPGEGQRAGGAKTYEDYLREAKEAITEGAPKDAVKKRFKELTGKEYPESSNVNPSGMTHRSMGGTR